MPGLDVLEDESIIVHRLVIDGLPVRFNSLVEGVEDSTDEVGGTGAALDYIDLADLQPPGGWTDRLDAVGGVVEAGAVSLSILTDELDGAIDAGAYLTALPNSSNRVAVLTETVSAAATTLKLQTDVSGETLPALWHIAHEAVWVTAAAGSQPDPDVADPYRVTVTRGAAGSRAIEHVVDPDRGVAPSIYRECCTWRRRRARLEVAYVTGQGSKLALTEWIELRRGFIEEAPKPNPDGLAFDLTLVPLSAILDLDIEIATRSTTLADGAHKYDGFTASTIEWAVTVPGYALDLGQTTAISAEGGGLLRLDVAAHDEIFDVSLATRHPRAGAVKAPLADPMFVESYNDVGGANEGLTVSVGPSRAVPAGEPVRSVAATEVHRLSIAAGVITWPGDLIDSWRAAATSSREGVDGAFVDIYPVGDPEVMDGWALMTENNCLDIGFTEADEQPRPVLWDPQPRDPATFRPVGTPLSWSPDVTTHGPAPRGYFTAAGRAIPRLRTDRLLYYPLFGRQDGVDSRRGSHWHTLYPGRSRTRTHRNVLAFPTAYYQAGEPVILAADDLPVPSTLVVTWSEPWITEGNGNVLRQAQKVRVTASNAVALPDGRTAYALTVEEPGRARSFGNWPGAEPATLRVDIREQGAADVLLDLLTETAGLDIDDDIDEASFRRVPDPIGLSFTQPLVTSATDLRDAVEPILLVTGTAMIMRTDQQGRNRVTRVPVGPENPIESIASLADDDCLDPPEYGTDDETIGRVVIRANYGPDGEPGTVQTFINEATINEAGGDAGTIELDLVSVRAEDIGDLFTPAELVFATVGTPRRVWSLLLPLSAGWTLFAGAVVRITSSTVRAHGGVGVVGLYARITSIRFDLEAGEVEIVAQHTGTNGTGWNIALEIIGVDDATKVTVSTTSYVPAEHPVTGAPLSALDLWAVEDNVVVRPTGGHDNGVVTKIAEIDTALGKVTFQDAHGIAGAPFGAIEPGAYDGARDEVKALAYLADAAGLLGAGDDPGQQPT